jgi:hypothetical protein
MGAKNGKRMKGTDGLSGLPEDPGHCIQVWYGAAPKRGIHKQSHGKIERLERIYSYIGGRQTR